MNGERMSLVNLLKPVLWELQYRFFIYLLYMTCTNVKNLLTYRQDMFAAIL